jgi:hypothetical protein
MIKAILAVVLILITTITSGQEFSLAELIKINNYKMDDFDTYVTQKGYRYYENKNKEFSSATSYVYSINGVKKSYITKFFRKTQPTEMISFQTGESTTYLKIKAELKSLGFKLINTGTYEGDTYFDYKKENIEISLTSSVQKNSYGVELTTYEISVTRTVQ